MNTESVFFYISLLLFCLTAVFHFLSLALKNKEKLFSYLAIGAALLLFPAMLFAEARLSVLVLVMLIIIFLYTASRYIFYISNGFKGKGERR